MVNKIFPWFFLLSVSMDCFAVNLITLPSFLVIVRPGLCNNTNYKQRYGLCYFHLAEKLHFVRKNVIYCRSKWNLTQPYCDNVEAGLQTWLSEAELKTCCI